MELKQQIVEVENRLLEAMKTSNVPELEMLLADGLVFTNHNGQLVTRQEDLDAHRGDDMEIYTIETSDLQISLFDDVAVVSVIKNISGSFFGQLEVGIFRYTRVWKRIENSWKVIAAHSSQIVK
jgi:hypothetical protein